MSLEPVIGLEVHVQLKSATKLFCPCSAVYADQPPNTHVCAVCAGHPGVLPVFNEAVLDMAIKAVLATGGTVTTLSRFDRKNYFYPDLPKAYQITQYAHPIGIGGGLEVGGRFIALTRIHIEEDAGKLIHDADGPHSRVDLNRAGVPLLEIVSEPVITSSDEARQYLLKLKEILQTIGVSDCNMEEGSLRCDANVSLRPVGSDRLGTKAEIKNLNSFKFVARAIEYEVERQRQILEGGGRVVQETRLFDVDRQVTASMRSKEEAHDYRYFPDPDLPPVRADADRVRRLRDGLPELPQARRHRMVERYGISPYDADVLTCQVGLAEYFETAARTAAGTAAGPGPRTDAVKNWIANDLLGRLNETGTPITGSPVAPEHLAALVDLIERGTISGKIAKDVFHDMYTTGQAPGAIVQAKGLTMISDRGTIEALVQKVLDASPDSVAAIKAGRVQARGHLVGQVMKETKGKASPQLVNQILDEKLR